MTHHQSKGAKMAFSLFTFLFILLTFVLSIAALNVNWMEIQEPGRNSYMGLLRITNSSGTWNYSIFGTFTLLNVAFLLLVSNLFSGVSSILSFIATIMVAKNTHIAHRNRIMISIRVLMFICMIFTIGSLAYFRNKWVDNVIQTQDYYCLDSQNNPLPNPPPYCNQFEGRTFYNGTEYIWHPTDGYNLNISVIVFNFFAFLTSFFVYKSIGCDDEHYDKLQPTPNTYQPYVQPQQQPPGYPMYANNSHYYYTPSFQAQSTIHGQQQQPKQPLQP